MPDLSRSLLSQADVTDVPTRISDTPPSSPQQGQLWYESDTGKTFVYYDSFWIELVGSAGPQGPAGPTGPAGPVSDTIYTITDGDAFEVDPSNGTIQLITLGANRTPKATNFTAGQSVMMMIDDGTARTITWTDSTWGTGGVTWVGGIAPTLATTGYTVIEFWKVGTKVYGALIGSVA